MQRREFIRACATMSALAAWPVALSAGAKIDPATAADWLARWKGRILAEEKNRSCDHEMGEEIGWLVSPLVNGFYYGYRATGDPQWLARLVDWTDSWVRRSLREPDGHIGWPKPFDGGSKDPYSSDSLLGEAMALRPAVLAAGMILRETALREKFGHRAEAYIALSRQMFQKWLDRDCWRETSTGGVWVVPEFGIENGKWTSGYATRASSGFTNPDNKQNHIARWLIAMADVTGESVYREHARKWWAIMKSRIKTRAEGKFDVWNYWEPAGPWDYKAGHSPRHWIGVHPNGGYYQIDVQGIVCAFEHGLVFSRADIDRLVATNRDFMWNQKIEGAKFQRIDGGKADPRWKNNPGVLWDALMPYDATLRRIFVANHDPASWGGLETTPWFLSLT